MTPENQRTIIAAALYAAFVDGERDDREREEIRRIAETPDAGQITNLVRGA